jgi:hypothetical protein
MARDRKFPTRTFLFNPAGWRIAATAPYGSSCYLASLSDLVIGPRHPAFSSSRYSASPCLLLGLEPVPSPAADAGSGVPPTISSTNVAGAPTTAAVAPANAIANDAAAALASSDPQTIEQVQSSVKDVKVDMEGDLVKAYVIFDFHGRDLSLELDGHLGSQDGYVKFVPVAGKLGSLPLPQSTLESAVSKMMSSPENREKLKLPDDISDVQIVDGKAVLSYK